MRATGRGEDLDLIDEDRFELAGSSISRSTNGTRKTRRSTSRTTRSPCRRARWRRLRTQDPLTIKAWQYDLVCNGFEIASGGIRNHKPETMVKAFEIAGLTKDIVEERFGGLYRAFQYGAPPHGGMAAGVDRIVMLLCGTRNLREITLFPMNQQAADLLMGAPSEAEPKQLRELHIRLSLPKE
jgi:aspartyl-tRNA synthetase